VKKKEILIYVNIFLVVSQLFAGWTLGNFFFVSCLKYSLPCKLLELASSDEYRMLMNFYDIDSCDRSYRFKHKVVRWLEKNLGT